MEEYRSRSYGEERSNNGQDYSYNNKNSKGMQDLRSYSTSYTDNNPTRLPEDPKKARTTISSSSSSSSWGFVDADLQRKKRVVSYRAYTVEGKLKGSFRKSFKWVKDKCNKLLN
ncbi:unnamed protein product [Cochlearia groenlandica]